MAEACGRLNCPQHRARSPVWVHMHQVLPARALPRQPAQRSRRRILVELGGHTRVYRPRLSAQQQQVALGTEVSGGAPGARCRVATPQRRPAPPERRATWTVLTPVERKARIPVPTSARMPVLLGCHVPCEQRSHAEGGNEQRQVCFRSARRAPRASVVPHHSGTSLRKPFRVHYGASHDIRRRYSMHRTALAHVAQRVLVVAAPEQGRARSIWKRQKPTVGRGPRARKSCTRYRFFFGS